MKSNIQLRTITEEDMPFLMEVYGSTREEEMCLTGWSKLQIAQFISMQFNAQHVHYNRFYPNAAYNIIVVNGQPAGRLYVDRTPNDLRIMDIALLPQFKRKGISNHFLRQLINEGGRTNTPVSLHVEKNNPAKKLYDRLGFEVVEDRDIYWFMEWKP